MAGSNITLDALNIRPYEGSTNDLRLDLNYRKLQRLPHDLFKLGDLQWLNLNVNKLSSIPPEIAYLHRLKWLYLENNHFERFPTNLCQLKDLVRLYFSCNQLRSVSPEIVNMKQLRWLDLSDNLFVEFPVELCKSEFISLEKLFFDGNKITCLPSQISNLKGLKVLFINDNRIEWLPQSICEMENLEEFQVRNNCIRTLPAYFMVKLAKLKIFKWDGSPLLFCLQEHLNSGLDEFRGYQKLLNEKLEKRNLVEFRSESRSIGWGKPCYRMRTRPRGVAVIIDNFCALESVHSDDVGKPGDSRMGESGPSTPDSSVSGLTGESTDALRNILIKLGFNVRVMRGLMSLDIISALRFVSLEDHSYFDCLVVCILSKGQEGKVIGPDGISVAVEQLTDIFTRENCPTLADKPKLFFLQILDTQNINRHPSQPNTQQEPERTDSKQTPRPRRTPKPEVFVRNLIPNDSDFLLTFALVPENALTESRQNVYNFYVEKLFILLEKYARKLNLLDILTTVHDEVRIKRIGTSGAHKADIIIEPFIQSSLKYNLYLSIHNTSDKR